MNDIKLWNICLQIYRDAYNKATPKANFNELVRTGEAMKDRFFMKYKLSKGEADKIINKYCKKYHINKLDKRRIEATVFLGCMPTF